MRRPVVLMVAVAVIIASCGGGSEEGTLSTSTAAAADAADSNEMTAPASQPTVRPGDPDEGSQGSGKSRGDSAVPDASEGASSDFCGFIAAIDVSPDGFGSGFDPDAFRMAMQETVEGLERAHELAPDEIADDVRFVLDTFLDFMALLEEYDYNLVAIGTSAGDDPRILAYGEAEFTAAVERIGAFCGFDLITGDPAGNPGD